MMKKRIRQWAALCAAVGIAGSAVMGCGSSAPKPDAGSGQTSREAADGAGTGSGGGAHIGIIFTEAGLGGNSFNDLALEGVKKANRCSGYVEATLVRASTCSAPTQIIKS